MGAWEKGIMVEFHCDAQELSGIDQRWILGFKV